MTEVIATEVIQDFAIIMVVASAMAMVSYKLKQPLIIGYIAAGMIIGPYTPPFSFILHPEILNLLAEIGIVLLLFVVGLEYPIAKLRSVGRKALVIAFSEAFGTLGLGFAVGQILGMSLFDSLFIALSISVTSTVVLSRVLQEFGIAKSDVSTLLLGVTVIEDIIIVSTLAVLQSVASTGTLRIEEVALSVVMVLAFIGGALYIGSKTIPKFVDFVSKANQVDVLIVAILGVAFGLSFIANQLGISVAAGAFFAGVLVAESKSQATARVITSPLKDMFAAIFFVSVGALMDVSQLPFFIVPALIFVATSFAAKFITVYLSAKSQGLGKKTMIQTAFGSSASGGELALVTAKGGADVGATSAFVLPMVGTMTIITSFLSPYVVKFGWKIGDRFQNGIAEQKEEHKNDDAS
ncbi:MAG TPA: cation:proton antiporter [Nitrososphaera sp.]|jgi:CPA2 family monovalent cation:H+ antiporter-2|nr:cation:proton antiporter [Nitrososphaera sp.]